MTEAEIEAEGVFIDLFIDAVAAVCTIRSKSMYCTVHNKRTDRGTK